MKETRTVSSEMQLTVKHLSNTTEMSKDTVIVEGSSSGDLQGAATSTLAEVVSLQSPPARRAIMFLPEKRTSVPHHLRREQHSERRNLSHRGGHDVAHQGTAVPDTPGAEAGLTPEGTTSKASNVLEIFRPQMSPRSEGARGGVSPNKLLQADVGLLSLLPPVTIERLDLRKTLSPKASLRGGSETVHDFAPSPPPKELLPPPRLVAVGMTLSPVEARRTLDSNRAKQLEEVQHELPVEDQPAREDAEAILGLGAGGADDDLDFYRSTAVVEKEEQMENAQSDVTAAPAAAPGDETEQAGPVADHQDDDKQGRTSAQDGRGREDLLQDEEEDPLVHDGLADGDGTTITQDQEPPARSSNVKSHRNSSQIKHGAATPRGAAARNHSAYERYVARQRAKQREKQLLEERGRKFLRRTPTRSLRRLMTKLKEEEKGIKEPTAAASGEQADHEDLEAFLTSTAHYMIGGAGGTSKPMNLIEPVEGFRTFDNFVDFVNASFQIKAEKTKKERPLTTVPLMMPVVVPSGSLFPSHDDAETEAGHQPLVQDVAESMILAPQPKEGGKKGTSSTGGPRGVWKITPEERAAAAERRARSQERHAQRMASQRLGRQRSAFGRSATMEMDLMVEQQLGSYNANSSFSEHIPKGRYRTSELEEGGFLTPRSRELVERTRANQYVKITPRPPTTIRGGLSPGGRKRGGDANEDGGPELDNSIDHVHKANEEQDGTTGAAGEVGDEQQPAPAPALPAWKPMVPLPAAKIYPHGGPWETASALDQFLEREAHLRAQGGPLLVEAGASSAEVSASQHLHAAGHQRSPSVHLVNEEGMLQRLQSVKQRALQNIPKCSHSAGSVFAGASASTGGAPAAGCRSATSMSPAVREHLSANGLGVAPITWGSQGVDQVGDLHAPLYLSKTSPGASRAEEGEEDISAESSHLRHQHHAHSHPSTHHHHKRRHRPHHSAPHSEKDAEVEVTGMYHPLMAHPEKWLRYVPKWANVYPCVDVEPAGAAASASAVGGREGAEMEVVELDRRARSSTPVPGARGEKLGLSKSPSAAQLARNRVPLQAGALQAPYLGMTQGRFFAQAAALMPGVIVSFASSRADESSEGKHGGKTRSKTAKLTGDLDNLNFADEHEQSEQPLLKSSSRPGGSQPRRGGPRRGRVAGTRKEQLNKEKEEDSQQGASISPQRLGEAEQETSERVDKFKRWKMQKYMRVGSRLFDMPEHRVKATPDLRGLLGGEDPDDRLQESKTSNDHNVVEHVGDGSGTTPAVDSAQLNQPRFDRRNKRTRGRGGPTTTAAAPTTASAAKAKTSAPAAALSKNGSKSNSKGSSIRGGGARAGAADSKGQRNGAGGRKGATAPANLHQRGQRYKLRKQGRKAGGKKGVPGSWFRPSSASGSGGVLPVYLDEPMVPQEPLDPDTAGRSATELSEKGDRSSPLSRFQCPAPGAEVSATKADEDPQIKNKLEDGRRTSIEEDENDKPPTSAGSEITWPVRVLGDQMLSSGVENHREQENSALQAAGVTITREQTPQYQVVPGTPQEKPTTASPNSRVVRRNGSASLNFHAKAVKVVPTLDMKKVDDLPEELDEDEEDALEHHSSVPAEEEVETTNANVAQLAAATTAGSILLAKPTAVEVGADEQAYVDLTPVVQELQSEQQFMAATASVAGEQVGGDVAAVGAGDDLLDAAGVEVGRATHENIQAPVMSSSSTTTMLQQQALPSVYTSGLFSTNKNLPQPKLGSFLQAQPPVLQVPSVGLNFAPPARWVSNQPTVVAVQRVHQQLFAAPRPVDSHNY